MAQPEVKVVGACLLAVPVWAVKQNTPGARRAGGVVRLVSLAYRFLKMFAGDTSRPISSRRAEIGTRFCSVVSR